jgi:IPTL-CTERM motif
MRHVRWILVVVALGVIPQAAAQLSPCTGISLPGGYINVTPPAPTSLQIFSISVGGSRYVPTGVSSQVQGRAINVTLVATTFIILPPPYTCATVFVGPLAPGTYVVNMYVLDTTLSPSPVFVQGTTLDIVAESNTIPTNSVAGLVALSLLLGLLALCALRSSRSARTWRLK